MAEKRARCSRCFMHLDLCICADIHKISTKTHLVLVIHAREIRKPTNTGRLACECLSNSEMHVRGRLGEPIDLANLRDPQRCPVILFPTQGARVLTKEYIESLGKPLTLVVPDGNWRQAARMPKREESLRELPRVILPDGGPTEYRLRSEPRLPYGLATMEAIARALGIIEGREVEVALLRVFKLMVERTLWTRGKLAAQEVFGGLPVLQNGVGVS